MAYSIEVTSIFKKQAKRLVKKFPSLKNELQILIDDLAIKPEQGTSLGNHCYKIRIAISSKGKGKSGGARIITHVQIINQKVFLLSIYDKSEQDNITDKEISDMLKPIQ
ncbi:MAG TPA: type II toxin-antitoxin system RelE/ParE family toxin [Cyclobacteriaceae bacterium]